MKILNEMEMQSINGGLPTAYYMDNDVINAKIGRAHV
jgi:bacteriocin-like protein